MGVGAGVSNYFLLGIQIYVLFFFGGEGVARVSVFLFFFFTKNPNKKLFCIRGGGWVGGVDGVEGLE